MKAIILSHKWPILLAALATILISLPTFLAPHALGAGYKGVPFLFQDYESTYLARIRELVEGHPLGSPMTYEYKQSPTPLAPVEEYIYALPTIVFHIPLLFTVAFSKFFFPFLLFLLVYSLAYLLLRETEAARPKLFALSAASLTVLGYDLVHVRDALQSVLGPAGLHLSIWTRLVHPIVGALFLFAFLISVWQSLKGKRYAWALSGLFLGLMSGYIFSFGISFAFLAVLLTHALFAKRWPLAKELGLALAIGLATTLIFARNLLKAGFRGEPGTALKNGLLLTHMPLIDKLLVLAALVWLVSLFYEKAKRRDSVIYMGSLLLACLLAMNQQILTGRTIWPQHFVQYVIPISMLAIVLSLARLPWQRLATWAAAAMIVVPFAYGALTANSYKAVLPQFEAEQRYAPIFSWLDENAPKDCVVLAREQKEVLAAMIPAFTKCDTYYTTYVFVGIPDERIKLSYFAHLRMNGVTPEDIIGYLQSHPLEVQASFFRDWKEIFRHTDNAWLASISDRGAIAQRFDKLSAALATQYREFYRQDFYTELKRFKIDYIVWDEEADPGPPPAESFLREVFVSSGVHFYAIK